MSWWNYRIMKRKNDSGEDEFGIHEVYYDKNGRIEGYTENSMVPFSDSPEGLIADFEKMKLAFEKEVLDTIQIRCQTLKKLSKIAELF